MGLPSEPRSYGQGTSGADFMRPFYWADEVEVALDELQAELATLKAKYQGLLAIADTFDNLFPAEYQKAYDRWMVRDKLDKKE